jgi:hypothetical protein
VPERVEHLAQRPLHGARPDQRRDGHHVGPAGRHGSAHPVDREDRIERDERVGGGQHDAVGLGDRLQDARGRPGAGRAGEAEPAHGRGGAPAHEPLLEPQLAVVRGDAGAQAVVARRQQPHPDAHARCHVGRDPRERLAPPQALGPHEVQADVAVAEDEPVGSAEPADDAERLARVAPHAPALLGVHDAGEGVQARVEVGRDVQAEQLDVVPHVAHDRDAVGADDIDQPEREARSADAARQQRHAHATVTGAVVEVRSPSEASVREAM